MAYSTSNPPVLRTQPLGDDTNTSRIWDYFSTDNATTVDVPGYFTNAKDLGIKANDLIYVTDTDASPVIVTVHRAISYSGTTLTISTGDTHVTGTAGS